MIALFAAAALAVAPASYCSPSGDVCYGVVKRDNKIVLRIDTFARYFGRYTLCVRAPQGRRTCGSFPIFRNGRVWTSVVRWQRQFPNAGRGTYTVTWRLGSGALGPPLRFQR